MAGKKGHVIAHTLSHRGLVRGNNEDYLSITELSPVGGKPAFLAILADGVGGHNAGEVASRIAVDTIMEQVRQKHPADDVHDLLEESILVANQAILEDVSNHPDRGGMGTTCVCVLIIGNTLYTAHLGDSRLYLQRRDNLQRLTRDHTLQEEMITILEHDGNNQSRSQPLAHVLTRYLGSPHTVDVDHHMLDGEKRVETFKIKKSDILLLCSDGITDMVSDDEIHRILSTCNGRKRPQSLVYHALKQGGHDNATAVVLQFL